MAGRIVAFGRASSYPSSPSPALSRPSDYLVTLARVGLGLLAPAAVPVELRVPQARGTTRVYRLCRAVGQEGLELERPVPFEPHRRVEVRFGLPGGDTVISLRGELVLIGDEAEEEGHAGAAGVAFIDPPTEAQRALASYVLPRLGLTPPA